MRILHTSDWHLGKMLANFSRLAEQEKFIDELIEICDEERIDIVIVAGDVYDVVNPPAEAERLFYQACSRLCNNGMRRVVVIAGNHDNPSRLTAASPISRELGIIMLGAPRNAEEGVELDVGEEKAIIVAMPYPSEKRLNEILSERLDEKELQRSYSQKIGEILSAGAEKFRKDTVNIITGHFYVMGGENSGSEREIQLGGALAVNSLDIPQAQYVALGHLHRPQKLKYGEQNIYYSGSPVWYDLGEAHMVKSVFIVEISPGRQAEVRKRNLSNYKPFVEIDAGSVDEALEKIGELTGECWATLKLSMDRLLQPSELKQIRSAKDDMLDIKVELIGAPNQSAELDLESVQRTAEEQFIEYYAQNRGLRPSDELVRLFSILCNPQMEVDEL